MEIKELNNRVDELAKLRKEKDQVVEVVKARRDEVETELETSKKLIEGYQKEIENTQNIILEALREAGNKNWKTEKATVSRKSTVTYTITDESKVIEQLKTMKLDNEYVKQTIIPATKQLFEKQEFEGVEKSEREYISVIVKQEKK